MAEKNPQLVEKSWDPITRIVGSLGIYVFMFLGNGKELQVRHSPAFGPQLLVGDQT